MSLQVWLPLNGNLNNQGLYNITPAKVGSLAFNVSGKIGQAIQISSDGQAISLPNYMNECSNYTQYSMCAWVYLDAVATNHSASILSSGDWNSSPNQLCFCLNTYSNDGYTKLLVPNSEGWGNGISLSNPVALNKWYHIAITCDGSKTYGYINGEYAGLYNGGKITSTSNTSNLYIGSATYYSGFTLKGKINDVRIYDNCLSAKEVKEISKGLVLHYPLKGFGGENLLKNGNFAEVWSNWGSPTIREIVTINEKKWAHIKGASGSSWQGYSQNISPIILNSKYTLSFTGYCVNPSSSNNINIGLHQRGDGNNDPQIWRSYILTPEPKRYSFTFTSTSTEGKNQFGLMMGAIDTAEIYFTDVKLECGSIATPWMPNPSDALYSTLGYGTTIESDCSGYANNGTKTGTIICDTSTPRYMTSYNFMAGSKISASSGFPTGTNPQFTINFWFNPPSNFTYTSYADVCGLHCTTTGYPDTWCRLEACGSPAGSDWSWFRGFQPTSSNLLVKNITKDAWNMITLVSDGTKMYTYTNGVNTGTMNVTEWQPNGDFHLGDSAGGISGKYSDLRIYATALSEKDIEELYKVPISITNNGVIITQGELME